MAVASPVGGAGATPESKPLAKKSALEIIKEINTLDQTEITSTVDKLSLTQIQGIILLYSKKNESGEYTRKLETDDKSQTFYKAIINRQEEVMPSPPSIKTEIIINADFDRLKEKLTTPTTTETAARTDIPSSLTPPQLHSDETLAELIELDQDEMVMSDEISAATPAPTPVKTQEPPISIEAARRLIAKLSQLFKEEEIDITKLSNEEVVNTIILCSQKNIFDITNISDKAKNFLIKLTTHYNNNIEKYQSNAETSTENFKIGLAILNSLTTLSPQPTIAELPQNIPTTQYDNHYVPIMDMFKDPTGTISFRTPQQSQTPLVVSSPGGTLSIATPTDPNTQLPTPPTVNNTTNKYTLLLNYFEQAIHLGNLYKNIPLYLDPLIPSLLELISTDSDIFTSYDADTKNIQVIRRQMLNTLERLEQQDLSTDFKNLLATEEYQNFVTKLKRAEIFATARNQRKQLGINDEDYTATLEALADLETEYPHSIAYISDIDQEHGRNFVITYDNSKDVVLSAAPTDTEKGKDAIQKQDKLIERLIKKIPEDIRNEDITLLSVEANGVFVSRIPKNTSENGRKANYEALLSSVYNAAKTSDGTITAHILPDNIDIFAKTFFNFVTNDKLNQGLQKFRFSDNIPEKISKDFVKTLAVESIKKYNDCKTEDERNAAKTTIDKIKNTLEGGEQKDFIEATEAEIKKIDQATKARTDQEKAAEEQKRMMQEYQNGGIMNTVKSAVSGLFRGSKKDSDQTPSNDK